MPEPQPLPQVHPVWEELEAAGPQVGIVIATEADREIISAACDELLERAITFELKVLSAHGDPREVAEYGSTAALRGLRVIIAAAGGAAALPGVLASYTELPVIGIPIRRQEMGLGGFDALLSVVQMPDGVPVACMAVNGAQNAAIYAAKILAQGQGPPPSSDSHRRCHRRGRSGPVGRLVPAVISRYTRPEMGAVWSDERRFQRWLDVEIAAMAGWADLGVVPADAVAAVRSRASVDVARILEIESRTHHDVLAFTESVSEQVGPEARWFHYGLTSSDVVDTALALQLRDAGELLLAAVDRAERAVLLRAEEHRHTPTIGRTHGVHAEPTTFGLKLLGWVTELRRDRDRLAAALEGVRVGKLSGAVGTYANCDPRVEDFALSALGLEREDVATQVIPRDRHATLLAAIAITGSSLDRFATEIRHLQRTEVREALEPFAAGQKGSSAMPHKQNPIISERISGLARVLRANAQVGFENVPLWHERDISHSSAERVVLPDSTIGLDYMLDRFTWLIEGLVVDGERMMRNLEASHGLVFSGRALLALVESGMSREDAYEVIQRNALRAWDEGLPLRGLLEVDPTPPASWTRPSSTGCSTWTASCATSTTCSTAPPSGWG